MITNYSSITSSSFLYFCIEVFLQVSGHPILERGSLLLTRSRWVKLTSTTNSWWYSNTIETIFKYITDIYKDKGDLCFHTRVKNMSHHFPCNFRNHVRTSLCIFYFSDGGKTGKGTCIETTELIFAMKILWKFGIYFYDRVSHFEPFCFC